MVTAVPPLSVTLTLTMFVLGPCASVGVQLIAPVAGLMVMPAGELARAKVKLLAGRSASVAVAFTLSDVCSLIVWSAGTVNTGARFTSLTVTLNVLVTLRAGTPLRSEERRVGKERRSRWSPYH